VPGRPGQAARVGLKALVPRPPLAAADTTS
jgi:hypothetical protein